MTNSSIPQRTFKDYLIPYYSCSYITKQSKREVLDKIAANKEPEKFFRFGGIFASNANTKFFEGKVVADTFKITKITTKR